MAIPKFEKFLFADRSFAANGVFDGGECGKSHRTSCVKLLRGDADLRTEAEHFTIREARGGVVIDGGCIHKRGEACGGILVLGDDRFAVACAKAFDVCTRFVERVHDLDVHHVIVVLGGVVLVTRKRGVR